MGVAITDVRLVRSDNREPVAVYDDDTAPTRWWDPYGGTFSTEELRALDDVAAGKSDCVTFDVGTRYERTLHLRAIVDLRRPR